MEVEGNTVKKYKYVDLSASYRIENDEDALTLVKAFNEFISKHEDGLTSHSSNILGYRYY